MKSNLVLLLALVAGAAGLVLAAGNSAEKTH